ncbi:hypothetical protein L202_05420 [Cryptococcus amylolentus CBS 6039]|uniref:methylated diphthine methylhydrolase n=2 Tax=Cryptococcus amylolentus TaxID=104669 RepID=A0A1E3HKG3_9TREE|nr:hypothetical protein L202_05420 [Cryptococcus amylolentus CBS 6039]ODN76820.1 hypothetical protein L202_05420 [Cryptococcus amylolentus CBS 6039]ODO04740.1 hypothetical protein I350_05350 [Cryptococcus amylolentus CBS 6273]
MPTNKATSLAYVDTVYSADSIEFCPFQGFQDLFVCGTYQIIKPEELEQPKASEENKDEEESDSDEEEFVPQSTQRKGRLLLFQIDQDCQPNELQRIETPAILDSKWSPHVRTGGGPRLAVADAKGHIALYELNPDTKRLEEVQTIDVEDETRLCLSLDFSYRLEPSVEPSIIASISNGSLSHLTPTPTGYEVSSSWHAHDFEPWITAFDLQDVNTVWSGGDDCKLKRWDLREPFMPSMVNKNFDGGVTTITPSPYTPNLLAIGSYDESLRLFDTRSPRTPLLTLPMGGGIWRVRWHPLLERRGDLLVASMHDGFKVVRLSEQMVGGDWGALSDDDGSVIKTFEAHESLAYGADWSRLPLENEESAIATCSFYDHAMHLWRG